VKPSNLLLDAHGTLWITDFGLAQVEGAGDLTSPGDVVGTVRYMAPERFAGQADARSDVYGLGLTLYELLTLRPAFDDPDRMKLIDRVRTEDPPRPRTIDARIPRDLELIVRKATARQPEERYSTAGGLAADLGRFLRDEPVTARRPTVLLRARKWARRNRIVVTTGALGLAVALAVLAGSIGWTIRHRAAQRADAAEKAGESLSRARAWIGEHNLPFARKELAEARGHIGSERSALQHLADEVDTLEAELAQFESFLGLIDQAHEVEIPETVEIRGLLEPATGANAARKSAQPSERNPTNVVPLLLKALGQYQILDRGDWPAALEAGSLGPGHVQQVRRSAYEELLWLADDIIRRREDHRSQRKLSPVEAAQQGLTYLNQAEQGFGPTPTFYRLRAVCRKALGEEAAARADEERAKQTPPTIALDHYLMGLAARDMGEGVKHFKTALRLEPTHYWSLMRLGYCLAELGKQDQDYLAAVVAFTGCILKRPDHAHAYFWRGKANSKLRRQEEAIIDQSRAIELRPDFASAWNNRGVGHLDLGQYGKAVADFSKAIELEPGTAKYWSNRSAAYHSLGQYDKAVAEDSKAIELDPDDATGWHNRGIGHFELRQYDKALADLSEAIELAPKYSNAWRMRGRVYGELREYDKALADLSRAIELAPNWGLAWGSRGNTYTDMGHYDEALIDHSKAIKLLPMYSGGWFNRGVTYGKMGQHDKAVADFSKAIELDPDDATGCRNRGIGHFNLRQYDKALADFSKAVELDHNYKRAIADFSEVIKVDPNNWKAWHHRAIA
jgi:tetratricopeptide (TPR) repeat protein